LGRAIDVENVALKHVAPHYRRSAAWSEAGDGFAGLSLLGGEYAEAR